MNERRFFKVERVNRFKWYDEIPNEAVVIARTYEEANKLLDWGVDTRVLAIGRTAADESYIVMESS